MGGEGVCKKFIYIVGISLNRLRERGSGVLRRYSSVFSKKKSKKNLRGRVNADKVGAPRIVKVVGQGL